MIWPRSDDALDALRSSIFRVEARWTGGGSSGTCFGIARQPRLNRLIVATAKHVLEVPTDLSVVWKVQGFNSAGDIDREVEETTDHRSAAGVPYTVQNDLDVGIY